MITADFGYTRSYYLHFNIKSSLLKLLCTLARLCEGTPLQPLRLNFFEIDFPSHPRSKLLFLTFREHSGQQNKGKGAQILWAHSAPQFAHHHHIAPFPPTSHLSPAKVSALHVNSRCRWRNVSLAFCDIISPYTHLFLPPILTQPVPLISTTWVSYVKDLLPRWYRW